MSSKADPISVHRLANPWFKPGTMEDDENRVLFCQPEFDDEEYDVVRVVIFAGRFLRHACTAVVFCFCTKPAINRMWFLPLC